MCFSCVFNSICDTRLILVWLEIQEYTQWVYYGVRFRMETSTPISSPKKKKHSLIQRLIPVDETLGDIESEIQTRRQEAINKSTESRRRLSSARLLAGYTATQLTQHCKDVIKLSTENKINCKNAFNFWLIDVMAAMAKKTDSEINKNFQVASCTLDASVKIYGYRVDAIHTDAVKMAGGFFSKEVAGGDAAEGEGGHEGGGEENVVKAKVKKKRKKLTVAPPESLNAKSEAEVLLDVIPRQNFLTRKADGNDLLIKIPKYNDGGLLLLDSDYPCWPHGDNATLVPKFENKEIFECSGLASLLGNVKVSADEELCPAYSNFEFGKGCEEQSNSEDELQTSQNSERFEFDANASIHDAELDIENDPEGQRNRIHIPPGGFDSDEDVVVVVAQQETQKSSRNVAISDMKTRISVNPSEYSMFDEKVLKAWAGPSHWKVRPSRKPLEEYTNNEDISRPAASKRTRKGKIKTPAGLFDVREDFLVKNMAECEKTTLFKSTMLNWSPQNTTMPEDLKCKAKNLFCLYHMPSFAVVVSSPGDENDSGEISDRDEEREGESGRGEELEYCSSSALHERNAFHRADEDQLMGGEDEAWSLDNMVEAPNRIEKIPVSTFKRRKHVDIRHLKKGLWNLLTDGRGEECEKTAVTNSIEFQELMKLFPTKMPKSFSSLLSAPLIFNALLHLTNEKCLILTQDKTNSLNFVISQ